MKPVKPSQLYNTLSDVLAGESRKNGAHREAPSEDLGFDPTLAQRLPLRILLAEDNSTNQQLALLTLERFGYRADVAANGLEVLEAFRNHPYNVILMDVQMPEMDGLVATQRLRSVCRPGWMSISASPLKCENCCGRWNRVNLEGNPPLTPPRRGNPPLTPSRQTVA